MIPWLTGLDVITGATESQAIYYFYNNNHKYGILFVVIIRTINNYQYYYYYYYYYYWLCTQFRPLFAVFLVVHLNKHNVDNEVFVT